jgi:hypothetical protein
MPPGGGAGCRRLQEERIPVDVATGAEIGLRLVSGALQDESFGLVLRIPSAARRSTVSPSGSAGSSTPACSAR